MHYPVWRDISIPADAALLYSLGYNATYMIPETIILVMVAFYLGSVLDFRQKELRVIQQQSSVKKNVFVWVGGILITFAVIFAAVVVFSKLQNPETGDFMITGLKDVNWLLVGLVSGISIAAGVAALVAGVVDRRSDSDNA